MSNEKPKKDGILAELRDFTKVVNEANTQLQLISQRQKASNEVLKQVAESLKLSLNNLKAALGRLHDLENSFPRTQQFLRSRGLNDVRQLDSDGWKALAQYCRTPPESRIEPVAAKEPVTDSEIAFPAKGSGLLN